MQLRDERDKQVGTEFDQNVSVLVGGRRGEVGVSDAKARDERFVIHPAS